MNIEIRSKSVMISGYVNAVERDSRILPASMCAEATSPFVEQVEAGAFQRAIDKAADVRLKFNHQRDIGSVSGKTLTLKEDSIGLHAYLLGLSLGGQQDQPGNQQDCRDPA